MASFLFGARISESIAKKTYLTFKKYDLLAPEKIIKAGWDFLVSPVMREGGYVHYDEKTSRQILNICNDLIRDYGGSLKQLHQKAEDHTDLENKLLKFKGIGPVTVNIFLRELRPFWEKSNPELSSTTRLMAEEHHIDLGGIDRKSMVFTRVEAGLTRLRKITKITQ